MEPPSSNPTGTDEQFRLLADNAPVLIWVSGSDKRCTWFNQPWLQFTGRTMEQELGEGWAEGVHPDDLAACLLTYTTAFDARQPFRMEYRLRRHDGEYRWVLDNGVPRFDAAGQFLGYIGSCVDITEQKEAQEQARLQHELLQVTLASIGDAVITTGTDGRVSFLNAVAEALTGWDQAEAAGLPLETVFQIINEQTRRGVENPALRALREGGIVGLANHTVLIARDGTEYAIDDSAAPIRDAMGRVIGVVLIFRDVTGRRRAEHAHAQLAAIVEAAEDAIISKTLDGVLTSWNAGAEQMYGYRAEEVIGQPISLLTPPEVVDELPLILERLKRGERIEHYETVRMRKDGTRLAVSLSISPIRNAAGQIVGASKIARDITERRRHEQEQRAVMASARCLLWYADVWDSGREDLHWDLTPVNEEAAQRLLPLEIPPGKSYALAWSESRLPEDKARMDASANRVVREGRSYVQEFRCRNAHGEVRWLLEDVRTETVSPNRWRAVGVTTDITERKQAERRLACEHAITHVLMEATTLEEAAPRILETVCECIEAVAGDLWEVDATAGVLRCTAVWAHSHSPGLERFQAATRSMTFPPGVGLPGRVWREQQTATITALGADSNFPRRQMAQAAGLEGGFAFPLSTGKEVFGVMEFFTPNTFQPEPEFLQMMTAIGHDIGQFIRRRRAEHALAEERERLRVTLASIGDAVIVTNAQGQPTFLNPVAERLTGWTQDQASGKPLDEVFHIFNEESRKLAESPVERVLREGTIVGLANHTVLMARDGTERAIDDSAAPIRDEAGTTTGVVLVFRDVTERRRAEEARSHLAAIVESSAVAIYSKDVEGIVTSWNHAAEELYGYSAAEMMGQAVTRIIPSDHADEFPALMERLRRGERIEQYETVRVRKDGQRLDVLVNISPLYHYTGQMSGASVIARDITDRKRAEEALRLADRRKDEFLAMLAHELRNPLAPMRNAVQILRFRSGDPPSVERVRDMMDRQVRHMTRLIDDLLDVSRITRGKISLQLARLDLVRLIRLHGEDQRGAFEAAGVALELELPATPVWVVGDTTRLTQVLDNLLENARKFTDRGGEVTVRMVGDKASGQAVLSVCDTGIGIEPETIPGLFEVFAQADRSLDRSRGGLGLGLPLLKGLIELHGGRVEARSEGIGQGAEFIVWLPQAEELPALSGSAVTLPQGQKRLRVLVVEDNRDAAESLRMLLELFGYEVTVAHSGATGVEAAHRERPDVVVCDIGLPGMDGFAVASALRQDPLTAAARLIAVTGYGQEEDRQRAKEAGFDDHLTKPVDPDVLLSRLAPDVN